MAFASDNNAIETGNGERCCGATRISPILRLCSPTAPARDAGLWGDSAAASGTEFETACSALWNTIDRVEQPTDPVATQRLKTLLLRDLQLGLPE